MNFKHSPENECCLWSGEPNCFCCWMQAYWDLIKLKARLMKWSLVSSKNNWKRGGKKWMILKNVFWLWFSVALKVDEMRFSWFFTIYVAFVLSGVVFLTIAHEDAHRQVCKYRGGNVTEMSYLPWNAFTKCSLGPDAEKDGVIEAAGYPAVILFGFFSCGLFLAAMPFMMEA